MKALEWRTIDKSIWGSGAWQHEPDKRQWKDEATGLPCLAVRNERAGHWCGYVGVPREHPWHGRGYIDACTLETPCGESYCSHSPDSLLSIHGGVTFSGPCAKTDDPSRLICHVPEPGEPDDVWWFGFNCHHYQDFAPAFELRNRFGQLPDEHYRTLGYVESECRDLAAQLAGVVRTP